MRAGDEAIFKDMINIVVRRGAVPCADGGNWRSLREWLVAEIRRCCLDILAIGRQEHHLRTCPDRPHRITASMHDPNAQLAR